MDPHWLCCSCHDSQRQNTQRSSLRVLHREHFSGCLISSHDPMSDSTQVALIEVPSLRWATWPHGILGQLIFDMRGGVWVGPCLWLVACDKGQGEDTEEKECGSLRETQDCLPQTVQERLGDLLRGLKAVIGKHQALNSVDILSAAGTVIAKVKGVAGIRRTPFAYRVCTFTAFSFLFYVFFCDNTC
ncbi:hypothetical protein JZ751_013793 [Albula glossodonta]|uniref:Rho GTPase-activating protein 29/45 N-terminal domain-containing protein n=1 Tax=Albula glossodonta TaxID=121402 RepID=A0A8T2NRS2_9TELE|nr:hypothetical protein JZ751_013793 [Albula glossodonta]